MGSEMCIRDRCSRPSPSRTSGAWRRPLARLQAARARATAPPPRCTVRHWIWFATRARLSPRSLRSASGAQRPGGECSPRSTNRARLNCTSSPRRRSLSTISAPPRARASAPRRHRPPARKTHGGRFALSRRTCATTPSRSAARTSARAQARQSTRSDGSSCTRHSARSSRRPTLRGARRRPALRPRPCGTSSPPWRARRTSACACTPSGRARGARARGSRTFWASLSPSRRRASRTRCHSRRPGERSQRRRPSAPPRAPAAVPTARAARRMTCPRSSTCRSTCAARTTRCARYSKRSRRVT